MTQTPTKPGLDAVPGSCQKAAQPVRIAQQQRADVCWHQLCQQLQQLKLGIPAERQRAVPVCRVEACLPRSRTDVLQLCQCADQPSLGFSPVGAVLQAGISAAEGGDAAAVVWRRGADDEQQHT